MPTNILMPALSPTMTEGRLAKWLKKEGDEVKAGDVIAEIETDKATMEVEAVDEGKLQKILVPEGTDGVAVNAPIAVLLGEGEDPSAAPPPAPVVKAPPAAPPKAPVAPAAPQPAPAAAPKPAPPAPAAVPTPAVKGERVFASPLARRIAADAGVDLKSVPSSGPHGRIVKADVEVAKSRGPAAKPGAAPAAAAKAGAIAPAAAQSAAAVAGGIAHHVVPHTSMRRAIARRLTESKQQVPHFYLTIDCEIDSLLKLRADLNAKAPEKGEGVYKLSVNDFVIRASAAALRKVPAANAAWSDEGLVMFDAVDISVAVAIPGGLITPIIRNADIKGLAAISGEMKALAAKAKEGKLKLEEFQGGTFSISNLGMFGIKDFAAVINPPQGCILAVGAGEQRPVVKAGALAIATVMSVTLSVDHRAVDGAVGAEYLAAFKKLIEDPITLLL
jgi:pyruvate dehydrogenase E2 component (dihydrolipoamide acetyltransferase)